MRVALLRQPFCRPAGLPDWPLTNGRPRGRYCGFCGTVSDISSPVSFQSVADNSDCCRGDMRHNYGDFSVAICVNTATLHRRKCVLDSWGRGSVLEQRGNRRTEGRLPLLSARQQGDLAAHRFFAKRVLAMDDIDWATFEQQMAGSCPAAWCRSRHPEQRGLLVQAVTAGRLTRGSSLRGTMVSRLM